MVLACSCLSSLVVMDRCYTHSKSVMFVLPLLNVFISSYMLCWGEVLSPYWAHKQVWIQLLQHLLHMHACTQKRTMDFCSSLVQTEIETTMFSVSLHLTHCVQSCVGQCIHTSPHVSMLPIVSRLSHTHCRQEQTCGYFLNQPYKQCGKEFCICTRWFK